MVHATARSAVDVRFQSLPVENEEKKVLWNMLWNGQQRRIAGNPSGRVGIVLNKDSSKAEPASELSSEAHSD